MNRSPRTLADDGLEDGDHDVGDRPKGFRRCAPLEVEGAPCDREQPGRWGARARPRRAQAPHAPVTGPAPRFITRVDAPPLWRRVVAIAVYTYTRASELRALTWADVDLERDFIEVHHTENADGEAGTTKTEAPRRVPLEPALVPLLREMREESGGVGRVVQLPDDRHLARALRTWLTFAGLDGPELKRSATRAALTWHDLRATGITWRAIRGDEPLRIMHAAGHTDLNTTQIYIRESYVLREGFGEVFPALPVMLCGVLYRSESGSANLRNHWRKYPRKVVEAAGIEPASARLQLHLRSRA